MLLKNVLGTGPKTKYGSLSGKLGKAVEKIEGQKAVGGFNFAYRDTGLAGALITCESGIAGHVSTVWLNFLFGPLNKGQEISKGMVFCYQNWADLLWEKLF